MPGALAALGPFFAVDCHPAGAAPAPPWRPASELAAPGGALPGRIAAVRLALAARGGIPAASIELRVAASAAHLGLVARLVAPALGAAALGHPPGYGLGDLWWQDKLGGPVPLSVPGGTAQDDAPPDGTARDRATWDDTASGDWRGRLLGGVIAPLTAATARLAALSGRVLWGNVASAVNAAAAQVARSRPDLAAPAGDAARALFASPWLSPERQPPGPGFRRSSCCLFYRLAPGERAFCGDCVLVAPR
ncbi:MAG TPA: (2Fe-2S)-binding protein [Trebonia sp.]|jgi:hypothetical protein|nr:(2Fe-2S)-binding protein [Trebonia sp.]